MFVVSVSFAGPPTATLQQKLACHVLVHMCSYFGPGNFSVWSVAILLQVSRVRFLSHHHPHSPPLSGIGGGAVGTPHLFLLTPTYPGDRVVDRCLAGGLCL